MNVLLTGAFGNIGTSALTELLSQRHQVRCFDLKTKANELAAQKLAGRVEPVWGDLRRPADVLAAVQGQDVILHLAFIIPKLSATGVESEKRPDWAEAINVGGTQNVIDAARAQPSPPRLVFASSVHVYGRSQHLLPPRTAADPVQPMEHYSRHKVECEERVRASGLPWTILRFAATLPISIKLDTGMFDVPLNNRMEFAHTRDVGLAVANAASRDVCGKLLLIGGGPSCQYYYREIVERILDGVGVGMLPDAAFSTTPFATDWMDTAESERLLGYQQRDLGDYVREMRALLGPRKIALVHAFQPLVRLALVRRSPYFPWPRSWMWRRRPVPQTA